MKRKAAIIFIVLFLVMLAVPAVGMIFQNETVSLEENRRLAEPAKLLNEAGKLNPDFTKDVNDWVSDHIGFRKNFVEQNGRFHYALFRKFPLGNPNVLGPEGALNHVFAGTIPNYQHKNLYPQEFLDQVAEGIEKMADYAKEKGARFYYYQCWDKPSVYPEQFPNEILQIGEESKTDQMIKTFREKTDVCVISSKERLTEEKSRYETYSFFGDPMHWTPRGAYIGYLELMEGLNKDAEEPYPVLSESDYIIEEKDLGYTLYGTIHRKDILEVFILKDPKARLTKEKLSLGAEHPRNLFYTNDSVKNKKRLLIIGDSYFQESIVDDIAESFFETILIWGDDLDYYPEALQTYSPDLVVVENAEREDRTGKILQAAEKLRKIR